MTIPRVGNTEEVLPWANVGGPVSIGATDMVQTSIERSNSRSMFDLSVSLSGNKSFNSLSL